MRIKAIFEKLRDRLQGESVVEYGYSAEEILTSDQFPAINILPAVEEAETNTTLGGPITQRWTNIVMVEIYAINDEPDKLEDIRDKVKQALIGFEFDASWLPLEYVGGEIKSVQGQIIFWTDSFRTETTLQYVRS